VESLKKSEVCDYHLHDEKGRIIITIEGEDVSEEIGKLKKIESIPHVIAADMQMAYSEDELDANIKVINESDAVPNLLNNADVDIERVVYHGDLKKKDSELQEFARDLSNPDGVK
jgi:nitrate reductase NapD